MKIKAAGNLFSASTSKCGSGKEKVMTICRDLLEQLKLAFSRKSKYHWLNGDNPVNIMSTTLIWSLRHASRSACHCLEAYATSIAICITKHNFFKTKSFAILVNLGGSSIFNLFLNWNLQNRRLDCSSFFIRASRLFSCARFARCRIVEKRAEKKIRRKSADRLRWTRTPW